MKLEWLEVLEFRHVTPGARMEFADGVNVIMGRNGTGKTNLLKLLGALTRWDVSALEKERFHVRFGAKAGELRLEVELKNVPPRPRFRVGVMEGMVEETEEDWLVRVVARAPNVIEHSQEYAPSITQLVGPGFRGQSQKAMTDLGHALTKAQVTLLTSLRAMVAGGNRLGARPIDVFFRTFDQRGRGRLDEGLEQFNRMNEGNRGDGTCPDGLVVEWISDNGSRGIHFVGEFSGSMQSWLHQMKDDADILEADLADVAPELAEAAQILGLARLRLLLRRTERRVDESQTFDTMKGITFKAILPNGTEFDHDKLSFGQKRMLTFLWYAAANEHGPIIVDELANGLHHAWIQKCFEVIGERQAFLSTQNPLILDFLDFTSAEHTARSMVRCEVGERGWRWGNLNTEEAERLYRACQANFMHVSEILRSEGLW